MYGVCSLYVMLLSVLTVWSGHPHTDESHRSSSESLEGVHENPKEDSTIPSALWALQMAIETEQNSEASVSGCVL